ncbi:MAG: helix-turn-helix domain-containing protein [Alphaproteobacteria bacterium]|nr:helix-turn-helix domain-containing protein [Alphaproteobacteria bacterium]
MKENEEIETSEIEEEVFPVQTVLALDLPLGDVLKNTREEKGLELSEIAQTLCIRESFLQALEEGDYASFPALVYGAGFLRSYASYLGLDANLMTKKFHHETSHLKESQAEPLTVSDKNVVPTKRFLLSLIVVVFLFGFGSYFCSNKEVDETLKSAVSEQKDSTLTSQTTPEEKTQNEVAQEETKSLSTKEEKVLSAPVMSDSLVQEIKPSQVDTKALSKELKALIPTGTPSQEVKEKQTIAEEKPAPTVYGLKEGARLSIKATSKVWVEVKQLDKVLLSKVLQEGDSYNPPLDAQDYRLRTGNAGALSVYIDGEFKKVLGRKGHILKDVELTVDAYEN